MISRPDKLPDSSPVTLRPYQPRDLDAIVQLDRLCFAESFRFSPSEMRRFAEASNATTLIAQVDTTIAGFIIAESRQRRDRNTYVVTLDVAAQHGRRGVGTKLLRAAEAAAILAASSRMHLHVHTANLVAIAFYERSGYRRTALLPRFYRDVVDGGDAFLYERSL